MLPTLAMAYTLKEMENAMKDQNLYLASEVFVGFANALSVSWILLMAPASKLCPRASSCPAQGCSMRLPSTIC